MTLFEEENVRYKHEIVLKKDHAIYQFITLFSLLLKKLKTVLLKLGENSVVEMNENDYDNDNDIEDDVIDNDTHEEENECDEEIVESDLVVGLKNKKSKSKKLLVITLSVKTIVHF